MLVAEGTRAGTRIPWRLNPTVPGLRVRLQPIAGLTKKGLFDDSKAGFLFQVPPVEEFARQYGYEFADYQTISRETFSRPVAPSLISVTFPTLFVDDQYEWTLMERNPQGRGRMPDPVQLAHQLIQICQSGTPFKFTATQPPLWGPTPEFSMRATLRSLKVAERGGEIDARYIDVTFTQWNSTDPLSTEKLGQATTNKYPARVTLLADGGATIAPQMAHPAWGWGKVAGPLTLHKLAKFHYGSYTRWTIIAKRNGLSHATPDDSLYSIWTKGKHHGPVIVPEPPEKG